MLDERLSYSEVNETGFSALATPFLQTEEKEEIFGEPVIEVLRKIGDKLHLPQSCINNFLCQNKSIVDIENGFTQTTLRLICQEVSIL